MFGLKLFVMFGWNILVLDIQKFRYVRDVQKFSFGPRRTKGHALIRYNYEKDGAFSLEVTILLNQLATISLKSFSAIVLEENLINQWKTKLFKNKPKFYQLQFTIPIFKFLSCSVLLKFFQKILRWENSAGRKRSLSIFVYQKDSSRQNGCQRIIIEIERLSILWLYAQFKVRTPIKGLYCKVQPFNFQKTIIYLVVFLESLNL